MYVVEVGTYDPEDSDVIHSVHLTIVVDPEGFFGLFPIVRGKGRTTENTYRWVSV